MTSMLDKIDHVVVLMLENRSLDNVLGWLYTDEKPQRFVGADTTPIYQGLQTAEYSNWYEGRMIPATRGTTGATGHDGIAPQPMRVPGFDPGEKYDHVTQQLFGSPSRPTTTNPPVDTRATMAGFAYDYDAAYETWDQLDQIMEAYTPTQLPILNGLAKAYAVSDAWHSSVPTQTNPNRAFSLCGTSLGRVNNTWDAVEQFKTKTIWNAIPASTSWGIYYHDIWHDEQCYTQYTFPGCNDALANGEIQPIATFYTKARDGSLPRFTYLEPKWGYGLGKLDGSGFYCGEFLGKTFGAQGNDYHPPTWMGPGEIFVNQVYNALTSNHSAWKRTLLIITFDEHGGTYDHVDPGWGAVPPDSNLGPDGFGFNRYGVRVPTLLVSPWVSAGTVFRSPCETLKFDHTSILATLLKWSGVATHESGLGKRVAVAPTFDGVFTEHPRSDVPKFTVPTSYAEQGNDCWLTDGSHSQPVGLIRAIVDRSSTINEIQEHMKAEFCPESPPD